MLSEIRANMTVLMLQLAVSGEMDAVRLVQEVILDLHRLEAMGTVLSALSEGGDDLER